MTMDQTQQNLYKTRRDRLRVLMRKIQIDALLITSAANRFYLSGFELFDSQCNESSGMIVIAADGRDWLATDSRYALAAEALWNPKNIFIYKTAKQDLPPLLSSCGALVGLEEKAISADFAKGLKDWHASSTPRWLAADGLVEKLRAIKQPEEILALEASFKLNHQMLDWLQAEIAQGNAAKMSEQELAWGIERFFRENGASGLAFASIVASGPHSALPHAEPRNVPIGENTPLLTDIGCRVNNYCSDQTRTFWLGQNPPEQFRKAMTLVEEAQSAALEIIKPGIPCRDVYQAAHEIFKKAGVEKHFTHGLGHGIGLETHEAPSLNPRSSQILQEGMVVTVEPGLYYPEWGGIRREHTVIVEKSGPRIL